MPYFQDLTGKRFGRWTVIERASNGNHGQTRWLCKCDCGTIKPVQSQHLREGRSVSCGCYRPVATAEWNKTHKLTHGGAKHTNRERLYKVWLNIHRRCECEYGTGYDNYGARGISVCPEWSGDNGYANFRDWALKNGYDPKALKGQCTIDRIDVNGNYAPSNCRWVNSKVQGNNKRSNHRITIDGETHTISEWADIVGIDQRSISSRIYNGWDEERAVLQPLRVW